MRTILHCDLNSYYASVELLSRPELKNQPVAVCGDPESRHGIILAKNEPAKAMGVVTAQTVWQARRLCPQLVLLPAHHDLYQEYSRKVNAIYLDVTDQVEAFSIDESWLDVTGSQALFGDGKAIADHLRRRIREELGLTVSVGVSFNKVFAKLGSDYQKPDATTCLSRENYRELLYPLPVGRMLFVGPAAEKLLQDHGIKTIGQLAACPQGLLTRLLGKQGESLHAWANGLDDSPVRLWGEKEPVKSVGNGMTFPHDLQGPDQWKQGLLPLCEEVGARLRHQKLKCQTLTVQIKDPRFKVISRQMKMEPPTQLTQSLFEGAMTLMAGAWAQDAPIRMLTVTASRLVAESLAQEQMDFVRPREDPRQAQLEKAIDGLRSRFGKGSVTRSTLLEKRKD